MESTNSASIKLNLSCREDFSWFFQQTHIQVYRYVFGLTGGPSEDVDDLVAEAYARAWTARGKFRGDNNAAFHWILKIAKNQVIDSYRRRKSTHNPEYLKENDTAPPDISLESEVLSNEQREILWHMFRMLPDDTQELLVLRYLLEWPVAKIAAYLKKKETAVSMAINRALKYLQDYWPKS